MDVLLRPFEPEDIKPAAALWNAIVAQGDSFPNEAEFTEEEALACCGQTETVCAFWGMSWWECTSCIPTMSAGADTSPMPPTPSNGSAAVTG